MVHLSKYDVQAQKLTEFSDDEITLKKAEYEKENERKKIVEFGGTIGAALLMFLLPVVVYAIHILCNENSCSFMHFPDFKKYGNVFTYFDLKATLIYFAYMLILSLLTVLPFGGKKVSGLPNKHEKFEYVANTPFCLIVFLLAAIALEVYGIGVVKFINRHYFHFITPSFLLGVVIAVYCYYRSFYVPLSALTANSSLYQKKLYNFFMGREVNPRIFGVLDLKMFTTRASVFGGVSLFLLYCIHDTLLFILFYS